jgi:phage/plasmid-like protein (TIGR03299 family)
MGNPGQTEERMSERRILPDPDSDATFLGWQGSLSGDIFPLYTITAEDHPSCHSTVSDVTLRKMHLRTPRTLSPYPATEPSPWHSLGIELNHPRTAREAIALARQDKGNKPGSAGTEDERLQSGDAFAFFDALVEQREAVYETAGVHGLGDSVWILAKLPGYIKVRRNDIVNKYLLLSIDHNGTPHVRVKLTPIRAVCNNSLTSTFPGAADVHAGHTHQTMPDSAQALEALTLAHSLYAQLDVIFNGMAARNITAGELRGYVEALAPEDEERKNDPGAGAFRESVLQLHDSGRGADLSRGTLWGALNSVTEYTDHMMMDSDSTNPLNSIWFGRGERLKLKAFNLAEQMLRA